MNTNGSHPLFLGLTRPPMLFGVSQIYFLMCFLGAICFAIGTLRLIGIQSLFYALSVFIFLYFVGRMAFEKDDHFFDILIGYLQCPCPNRTYWGCDSYDSD